MSFFARTHTNVATPTYDARSVKLAVYDARHLATGVGVLLPPTSGWSLRASRRTITLLQQPFPPRTFRIPKCTKNIGTSIPNCPVGIHIPICPWDVRQMARGLCRLKLRCCVPGSAHRSDCPMHIEPGRYGAISARRLRSAPTKSTCCRASLAY